MRKKRKTVRHHSVRLPCMTEVRDVYIDPKTKDVQRDGSKEHPFKSFNEMNEFFTREANRVAADREKKLKEEREAYEKEERERYAKDEADRQAREAERKAKEKALDDKIAVLEVELTSLEKTYLETMHLFEIAQLELIAGETVIQGPKALATQLHHLRMALMSRYAEHTALVEERGKKSAWASVLGGPLMWLIAGGAALWAYQLFGGGKKK